MLYVKINEEREAVGEPINETAMRRELGDNVSLPTEIKDEHINPLGFACVGETTSDLTVDKTTILKPVVVPLEDGDTLFTRTWELAPYPHAIGERVAQKWKEIRQERNKKLTETDFAASDDYFYMKDLFIAYRNQLRDISEQSDDPFLVVFPTPPHDPKNDTSLEGRKQYALYKNEELFLRGVKQSHQVETPLGFSVLSGENNYRLLKGSLEMGINLVYDTDNQQHKLSEDEMRQVVNAVEKVNQGMFERKKTFEETIVNADETTIGVVISEIKTLMS